MFYDGGRRVIRYNQYPTSHISQKNQEERNSKVLNFFFACTQFTVDQYTKTRRKKKREILIFPTFFIFHVGQSFTTFLESFVTKIEITEEKMKDRRKENCVWSHAYPVVTLIQWSSQRPMCHFTPKPSHDVDAIITMVKCGNSERQTCLLEIYTVQHIY